MISRFMLQIANGAQSPTYLTSLENFAKFSQEAVRVSSRRKDIFDLFFLLHMAEKRARGKLVSRPRSCAPRSGREP
jgi:hypothetical protein